MANKCEKHVTPMEFTLVWGDNFTIDMSSLTGFGK
jgi:hypothetical protein